jgi:DNA ligase-1
MRDFAQLYAALDASNSTADKVAALRAYFERAQPQDAAWAVYFLAGGKPRQTVPTAVLRATALRLSGLPDWLFEESYQAVGDLAETISLVLPPSGWVSDVGLAQWIEERLLPLRGLPADVQAERLGPWWMELDTPGRFLLTKLIGGGFRVGVSKLLVQRALAEHAGVDAKLVAQRMMGYTDAKARPDAPAYQGLIAAADVNVKQDGQPYPFFLSHQLEVPTTQMDLALGPPGDWIIEWKYDGIRAQLVKRAGSTWIWSRGEELMTERFPEVVALAQGLPDGTVLDGEILVWKAGEAAPSPFNLLQQRIGRKTLTKKVLAEAPVSFMAYDILEWLGADVRQLPQRERRAMLEQALAEQPIRVSPAVGHLAEWDALDTLRQESRERGVEGFMLKHHAARYGTGRTKAEGLWWKWKIAPLTVDGVLIYAQAGHGRRASVYTDYTFAVWNRPPVDAAEAQAVVDAITRREPAKPDGLQLVAFAKAYSGLSDEEFQEVDRIIRANTLEKFGPVRSVRPTLVFELGFEGINASARHKSGIAVRFPRMLRIRHDKPLHEADTLATLQGLMNISPRVPLNASEPEPENDDAQPQQHAL